MIFNKPFNQLKNQLTFHYAKGTFDVFGSRILSRPPDRSSAATSKIGTAQDISMKYPNTTFPKMAPTLATAKVTAIAVDLKIFYKIFLANFWR